MRQILQLLPHRYPFLLIDRVEKVEVGRHAVGIKNITINEPFFQGHFPEELIMPGVLIVEAMAQIGGIAIKGNEEREGGLGFLVGIDNARFRRQAKPGDQLRLVANVVKKPGLLGKVSVIAYVDSNVIAEADLMLMFSYPSC